MPVYITAPQTNTFYIDEPNQGWVVTANGSIAVANGHGIVNNDAFHDSAITVAGDITADGMYKSGIFSNGPNATLKIEAGGNIHAYSGIAFYGDNTTAQNLGHITAEHLGIYANADDAEVLNAGTIEANIGVYFENTNGTSVFTNTGTIKADKGFVAQNTVAYISLGATSVIDAKSIGIELAANPATANLIKNGGLIKSADIAIQGNSTSDRIENSGTINGKIVLGDGNDMFDNLGGTIDHAVDGGAGDDYYVFGDAPFAIIDSSGNDTIGTGFTYTLAADNIIENLYLVGSKNINGTGNAFVNTVTGNSGNNVLYGGNDAVVDTLIGGKGNDTYALGSGHDIVEEGGKSELPGTTQNGIDTITSTISRSLADHDFVEGLTLLGNSNINGTGGKYANVIVGNSGNNILNGGMELEEWIDTLNGAAGNDTYLLGSGNDKVIDSAGNDTITSIISRSLAGFAAIENLTLEGNGNVAATGNALANVISGNAGNNILDGGTDTVTDTLKGAAGNDVYILASGTDTVIDTGGHDTITSTTGRSLANYATIEDLVLKGTSNVNATGNALANLIAGNAGNNILDGGSDNVVDTLKGDVGNDTYVLGSGADIVSDGGGIDTITSTISRSLASYSAIENLTLIGNGNFNATGNALANVLTGNAGTNTLNGGAGNDTYVLGSGADKVVDVSGTDTITSLISRNLSTFATIENLKLLGVSNISGTGNALANTLTGNAGVNTLSGAAGNDELIGGAGADKLDGGANTDTASYAGASAGVVANLSTAASNTGDAKGDVYVSIENLTGSSHNDMLTGNAGANVLTGGTGADKMTGGAGADTFLFKAVGDSTKAVTGQDTIFDFGHAQGDRISLSGINANTAMTGDQAFVFKGAAAFSGTHGELRFEKQASDTYVYGDTNGDKVADFAIHFDDAIAFQASDFLF